MWGAERPSTIAAALNVHLSKIRKLVATGGTDAALVTELHGYALRIDPERLDVHRFERLGREGRQALLAGRPEEASAILERALALWRGPPLAELELDASVGGALGRLCELRLSALEDRFEAGLQAGRHTELAAELEEFVREHPLRERARAELMIALYRAGRQSEALHAYRDVRVLLAEELGLDPGPELQRLEKAILVQDPSLSSCRSHAGRRGRRVAPPASGRDRRGVGRCRAARARPRRPRHTGDGAALGGRRSRMRATSPSSTPTRRKSWPAWRSARARP